MCVFYSARCIDSSRRVKSISPGLSWIRVTNLSFLLSLFLSIYSAVISCQSQLRAARGSKLPWNCRKLFRMILISGNRSLNRTFPDILLLLLHTYVCIYLQPWTQIRRIDLSWLHSNVYITSRFEIVKSSDRFILPFDPSYMNFQGRIYIIHYLYYCIFIHIFLSIIFYLWYFYIHFIIFQLMRIMLIFEKLLL